VGQYLGQQTRRRARRAVRWARPVTAAERIERAQALDRPVAALSGIAVRSLPPGRRTDLLHGVPLGQPAHPAMARLPVGCWTSAVLVDLLGGRGGERAAAMLVGAGLAGASHAEPIGHLAVLGWHDLCPVAALPQRQLSRHQLGYLSVVAVRDGDAVHVLADRCAHLGGPLHQGLVSRAGDAICVTCPWHGSTFRLDDGTVLHGPATARQPAFETRVTESGLVQVRPLGAAG
jgi:nitrite reductase/ring-hydroxylating ferredoxin subunit